MGDPERRVTTPNGTLIIPKVRRQDQGIYTCHVTNNVGPTLETSLSLRVIVPARFEDKFSVESVRRGDSITLECHATGDKPLSIAWSKDKKLLELSKHPGLEKFDQETEDGLKSELMVRAADRTDGALYTCFAKNEFGVDERNVKLLVVEVPAPPLDVNVHETWSKRIHIQWTAPYTGNSPITHYIVQYWRDMGGSAHRLHEEKVPSAQTTAMLKGLKPGTTYAISLIAENEVGQSDPSEPILVTTDEEEPSGPPTDVKVEPKGSGAILITWKAPPREYWNGELKGYFVGYKAVDSNAKQFSFKTVDTMANDTFEYLLTNLMKSTKYSIVVKAFNKVGTGPPSQELTARTLDGEVPLPPPIALAAATDNAISVRWGESPAKLTSITGYTLHYKKEPDGSEAGGGSGATEWYQIPIVSPSLSRYTVTGLERGSTYRVYLRASNRYGSGDPSEILTVRTTSNGVLEGLPFYLDLAVVIPAAACFLAFLVIITVIAVFIHKVRRRRRLEKAIHGSKGQYGYHGAGTLSRDKRSEPTPASTLASYATLPRDQQELKTFDPASMKDRPLPQHPNAVGSLPKKSSRLYDTAE